MRIHTENITVDDADVLDGTALQQLEAGGQLDIFVLSTQADTLFTLTGPDNEPIAQAIEIQQETRAIRPGDDIPLSLAVISGGHYTANVDIITAGTVQFMAIYRKAGLDF